MVIFRVLYVYSTIENIQTRLGRGVIGFIVTRINIRKCSAYDMYIVHCTAQLSEKKARHSRTSPFNSGCEFIKLVLFRTRTRVRYINTAELQIRDIY